MRDNPEGGELDPGSSCIGKWTKEGCNRGSEVGKCAAGETGKSQLL